MKIIRKTVALLLTAVMLGTFSACGSTADNAAENESAAVLTSSAEAAAETSAKAQISETEGIVNGMEIDMSEVGKFDFENKRVLLNSGYYMPIVGLGTYALKDDICINSVNALLENGGRLIDTASFYGTEDSVGEAVRKSSVPRDEIFVTTKLYPNQFANAAEAIDEALEETGLDYIDLMLLHHPGTDDVKAYKAMERRSKTAKSAP